MPDHLNGPSNDTFGHESHVRSAMHFLNDCINATDAENPEVWIEALYRLAYAMHRDLTRQTFDAIVLHQRDLDGRGTE